MSWRGQIFLSQTFQVWLQLWRTFPDRVSLLIPESSLILILFCLKSFLCPHDDISISTRQALVYLQPWWPCLLKGNTKKSYWFSMPAYHLSVKNKGNTLHREPEVTSHTEPQHRIVWLISISPIARFLGTFLLKWVRWLVFSAGVNLLILNQKMNRWNETWLSPFTEMHWIFFLYLYPDTNFSNLHCFLIF